MVARKVSFGYGATLLMPMGEEENLLRPSVHGWAVLQCGAQCGLSVLSFSRFQCNVGMHL